jgi:hypothetical protein
VFVALLGVPVGVGVAVGVAADGLTGVLVALPFAVLAVVVSIWLYVRFLLLAAPALVLEGAGVRASVRRARDLSRGQFWRLFGIWLLTGVVAGVVGQVIGTAFAALGLLALFAVGGTEGGLLYILSQLLSQVLVGTLTTPFTSAVTALQYVDQRIRKEGLDVALIAEASRAPGERR